MRIDNAVARATLALSIAALARPAAGQNHDAAIKSAPPAEAHCHEATLVECTRTRVASLNAMSRSLREQAAEPPPAHLSGDDKKQLEHFNQWLKTTADQADALSKTGANSLSGTGSSSGGSQSLMGATQQMQDTQMSFNLQYLMLQESVQNDSRQYSALSGIMKTKSETAKRTLANLK